MATHLPSEVQSYLAELVNRLENSLHDQLLGVYLFGSASHNAYQPGISDIDVQAIVRDRLSTSDKQAIIAQLNHNVLPCPATKLEFVIYTQNAVMPASRHPRFELNLNTGVSQSDHISLDPAQELSHWFLLDIAMGRDLGHCLYGLMMTEAFGAIPRRWILEAISDSLEWHLRNESTSTNSVLNACRSWQYISSGHFSSKVEGGKWAMQQLNCPQVVEQAIKARTTKQTLLEDQVKELYDIVRMENTIKLETVQP